MIINASQGDLTSGSVFFATVDEDGKRNILNTRRQGAVDPTYHRSIYTGILFERPTDKFPNNPYQKAVINMQMSLSITRYDEVAAKCNKEIFDGGIRIPGNPVGNISWNAHYYPNYTYYGFQDINSEWTKTGSTYTQQTTVKNKSGTVVGHINRKMTLSGELFSLSLYDGVLVEYDEETETYSRTKGPAYTDFTQDYTKRISPWYDGVFFDYSSQAVDTTKTYYGRVEVEITNDFDEFFYEMLFSEDGFYHAEADRFLYYPEGDASVVSATFTLQ